MRRLLATVLVAVPVFVLLAWWNAFVAVLFGIGAITWVLAPVYFRYGGQRDVPWLDDVRRDERR